MEEFVASAGDREAKMGTPPVTVSYDQTPEEALRVVRASGRTFFLGLTNNLDRIVDVDCRKLSELASKYELTRGDLNPESREINSIEELLSLFIGLMHYSRGGEGASRSGELCRFIGNTFSYREAMGGTGVRASQVIEEAGISPIVHLISIDGAVGRLVRERSFTTTKRAHVGFPGRRFIGEKGGQTDRPHYIFQYRRGDHVRLSDGEVVAESDNRLILTFDPLTEYLPIDRRYLRRVAHVHGPANVLVSGFNAIRNGRLLERKTRLIRKSLERCDPSMTNTVLELAAYKRSDFSSTVLSEIGSGVDFVSMNVEELRELAPSLRNKRGGEIDESFLAAANDFIERYRLKNLVVHSAGLSLCLSDGTHPYENLKACLRFANAVAATFAAGGQFDRLETRIARGLSYSQSASGSRSAAKIDGMRIGDRVAVAEAGRELSTAIETIGLGDAFVGTLVLFLEQSKQTH